MILCYKKKVIIKQIVRLCVSFVFINKKKVK